MTRISGDRSSVAADDLPLLQNEPRIPDFARQDELTQRFLTPALPELEAMFLHIRATLDPVLSGAQPAVIGKPYPLGQCLEISQAVMRHLESLDPATLPPGPARGFQALADFLRHGGSARQVWGDLRGQYFQNAFLVGTLYLDSANDTVVPTKPKVEILPFHSANFVPVQGYVHFARVARRYWKAQIIPNHILPSIAPYFPLLAAIPGGSISIPVSDYMFGVVKREGFASSMRLLSTTQVEPRMFDLMQTCLEGSGLAFAQTVEQGRVAALKNCVRYHNEKRHIDDPDLGDIVAALHEANRHLARLRVAP